jgi:hypothetical protein
LLVAVRRHDDHDPWKSSMIGGTNE